MQTMVCRCLAVHRALGELILFSCIVVKRSYTSAITTLFSTAAPYPAPHRVQLHESCYEAGNNDTTAT